MIISCPVCNRTNITDDMEKCPTCDSDLQIYRVLVGINEQLTDYQNRALKLEGKLNEQQTVVHKKQRSLRTVALVCTGILIVVGTAFVIQYSGSTQANRDLKKYQNQIVQNQTLSKRLNTTIDSLRENNKFIKAQLDERKFFNYRVQPGESISLIAKKFFNDVTLYTRIYEFNKNEILSPEMIYTDQIIKIPME